MKKLSVKALVVCSLLVALSIVMGKFLSIPVGETLRFSFENTPLFMAGFIFGPWMGLIVATVADLLGSLIRGFAINPVITLGAAALGFSGGLLFRMLKGTPDLFRIALTVFISHLIGSVLIKTAGLAQYSGSPYLILLPMRCANYAVMFFIDFTVLYLLRKNRAFNKLTESIK